MCMMHATLAPIGPVPAATNPGATPPAMAAPHPLVRRRTARPVARTLTTTWRRALRWFKPPAGVARHHASPHQVAAR